MIILECSIVCTFTLFVCMIARFLWPCLYHWSWVPFVVAFIVCLMVTVLVHMAHWKCWRYLFHTRRRLHSSPQPPSPIRLTCILSSSLALLSIGYGVCRCDAEPLWPALLVGIVTCLYTLVACSSSYCSSCSLSLSAPSMVNASANLASSGGSCDGKSSGMSTSSSDDEPV